MSYKYCINCENPLDVLNNTEIAKLSQLGITDFCSQSCADEYLSNADERVMLLSKESNPDALPVSSDLDKPAIKFPRSNSGHLTGILPSTLEAVQSLLQIGGVSQETIDNVINIDKANSKQLTSEAQPLVKNNSQNDTDDGNV